MKKLLSMLIGLSLVFSTTSMALAADVSLSDVNSAGNGIVMGPKYEYQTVYDPPANYKTEWYRVGNQPTIGYLFTTPGHIYINEADTISVSFSISLPVPHSPCTGSVNIGKVSSGVTAVSVYVPADGHRYAAIVRKTSGLQPIRHIID